MDILVLATMKNAAKCDTSCELQNPVNHQMFERRWRLGEVPRQVLMSVGSKYQASPPLKKVNLFPVMWRVRSQN